jgi:hypothetical protein
MSRSIHTIARHFLNKDSLDQCSVEEIRELAEKHPYTSALQFLLLEKLRTADQQAYQAQVQKSILYYHDPVGFQYILDPSRFITELPDEKNNGNEQENPQEIPTSFSTQAIPGEQENSSIKEEPLSKEEETIVMTSSEPVEEPAVFTDHVSEPEEPISPDEVQLQEITIKPINLKSAPSENDLVFEPYHTVDYFASQGIKLSQEEFSKDKFGKQLKSFTEWLKSMKRLPDNPETPAVDSRTEDKVQHLAEDSIHQSEVYTEAMADVWVKQGNKAKAIEVYNKLSLINPSKRAYFATQIENLKQS